MEELRQWLSLAKGPIIAAGGDHSLLLLETGEVYSCGSNGDGQLGLGDSQDRNTWHCTRAPGAVTAVVAGVHCSFLLLETGELYACGINTGCQLGVGNQQGRSTSGKWQPVQVP
jgi:alpha-tubulin suppressor-like RCC1 family protein